MNELTNIKPSILKWHQVIETRDTKILDELLAEDVVFHSPVVWAPQEGKLITKVYLVAAMEVLGAENSHFTYTSEVMDERKCLLEFTTVVDGITINGMDIIDMNDEGKIVSFKVMVRPLKAINKLHEKMGEMLQKQKLQ